MIHSTSSSPISFAASPLASPINSPISFQDRSESPFSPFQPSAIKEPLQEQRFSLIDLPSELLVHIAHSLAPNDQLHLALTCQACRNAVLYSQEQQESALLLDYLAAIQKEAQAQLTLTRAQEKPREVIEQAAKVAALLDSNIPKYFCAVSKTVATAAWAGCTPRHAHQRSLKLSILQIRTDLALLLASTQAESLVPSLRLMQKPRSFCDIGRLVTCYGELATLERQQRRGELSPLSRAPYALAEKFARIGELPQACSLATFYFNTLPYDRNLSDFFRRLIQLSFSMGYVQPLIGMTRSLLDETLRQQCLEELQQQFTLFPGMFHRGKEALTQKLIHTEVPLERATRYRELADLHSLHNEGDEALSYFEKSNMEQEIVHRILQDSYSTLGTCCFDTRVHQKERDTSIALIVHSFLRQRLVKKALDVALLSTAGIRTPLLEKIFSAVLETDHTEISIPLLAAMDEPARAGKTQALLDHLVDRGKCSDIIELLEHYPTMPNTTSTINLLTEKYIQELNTKEFARTALLLPTDRARKEQIKRFCVEIRNREQYELFLQLADCFLKDTLHDFILQYGYRYAFSKKNLSMAEHIAQSIKIEPLKNMFMFQKALYLMQEGKLKLSIETAQQIPSTTFQLPTLITLIEHIASNEQFEVHYAFDHILKVSSYLHLELLPQALLELQRHIPTIKEFTMGQLQKFIDHFSPIVRILSGQMGKTEEVLQGEQLLEHIQKALNSLA